MNVHFQMSKLKIIHSSKNYLQLKKVVKAKVVSVILVCFLGMGRLLLSLDVGLNRTRNRQKSLGLEFQSAKVNQIRYYAFAKMTFAIWRSQILVRSRRQWVAFKDLRC